MPTPVPTPEPTPPTPVQFSVPAISIECGGSITVTNFAAANVEDVLITPGDLVIDGDGTFPLEPGDYTAVGRVGGEVVTEEPVEFTIEECPTEPTPAPTPEPTPAGGVGGATDAACRNGRHHAPADRHAGDAAQTTGGDSWRLILLALAGTLAAALLLTPARAVRKDR